MIAQSIQKTEVYIDNHFNAAVDMLQNMIRQPSIQGNETGVQKIVAEKLNSLGLEVDQWAPSMDELQSHPYFVKSRDSYEESPNVVGVWRGIGGGRSIILNGHIDVVPEGDRLQWTHDPFSGKVENGKIFGRGSTDMKGGNIALLLAMESIKNSGIQLRGDVIFQSVMEEETGGVGTLATLLRGYRADAALVPEPTNMRLFIRQQGSMWFRVKVEGVGAHAGTRYEGVSAIEKAMLVCQAILELESQRNKNVTDPLYAHAPIPFPINIGKITSGNWPSSVPDLAVIEGRIGVAPGEEMDSVKDQLKAALRKLSDADAWLKDHPVQLEFFGAQWIPNAVDRNHPFVSIVEKNFKDVYQRDVVVEASPWGTDAGLLGKIANIPSLVIGPGVTKMAHFPNEYIVLEEVKSAAKLFARIILEWCA